jgi:sortase A
VKRRVVLGIAGLLFALGGWQAGAAIWIHAKAVLAQVLIKQAWAEAQDGQGPARPWPWADTTPVARLEVPALGIDEIVLAGASGRTLAFGPGHMDGTPLPGAPGLSVISAHRDTHFSFLRELVPGQVITLTDATKTEHRFRVTEARVVDSARAALAVEGDTPRLALVTCYPFDAIRPGGPLRYIVFADPEPTLAAGLAAR